jgi:hypothetical protein
MGETETGGGGVAGTTAVIGRPPCAGASYDDLEEERS